MELDDGTTLPADLVVVGIGVQPVTEFVRGVELDPDGGLPVDEHLRVAPGVWAGGRRGPLPRAAHAAIDVRIEHWRLAEQHGRAAAAEIAGEASPSPACPSSGPSTSTSSSGYAGAGQGWRDVELVGDAAARDFTAFYARDGRLVAACGTQRDEIGAFVELMREGRLPARRRAARPSEGGARRPTCGRPVTPPA